MTNTQYQLTAKIHELLPQINQKYGLKIEVKPASYQYKGNNEDGSNKYEPIYDIGEKQIQQILVGLSEVLGENPEYIKPSFDYWIFDDEITDEHRLYAYQQGLKAGKNSTKSQAEDLYKKWCYGFPSSLFDQDPEMVLTELVEI